MARGDVIVLGYDAGPGAPTDHLVAIVRALRERGVRPLLLLVGDGERLAELRGILPVTVVDHFRRRGAGVAVRLAGGARSAGRWKVLRLRRWFSARRSVPLLLADPRALANVRHHPGSPRLAVVPPPGLAAEDVAALIPSAHRWLAASEHQAAQVTSLGPSVPVGVAHLAVAPLPPEPPDRWPVVLLPTPDAWSEVDHAAEVAAGLLRAGIDRPVRWVVDGSQDRWLAEHDLAALGLPPSQVQLVSSGETSVEEAACVVRVGYGPTRDDLLELAAAAGTHVVAFDRSPSGAAAEVVGPFEVDAAVAAAQRAADDPQLGEHRRLAHAAHARRIEQSAAALDELTEWIGSR